MITSNEYLTTDTSAPAAFYPFYGDAFGDSFYAVPVSTRQNGIDCNLIYSISCV